ncbi:MAG: Nif11-like leader peptide family RiPP precursor [Anaerolineales bacterium]|nr:Nif11-like leader peptide family natural product precursor [Chloroflexota bacterium]MBL6982842.1 Nif11-like leader peptide family RiPP precursor [Anaerolineales bacterium]
MSVEQVTNFLELLEKNLKLIEEAKSMNLGDILLLAQREGFEISNRDWKEFIGEKIRQANLMLSDAELEQVAAGGGHPDFDPEMFTHPPVTCLIGCG